jgi:hypothetical protein
MLIDLVAATTNAAAGVVEHAIFGEDLVDGRASPRGGRFQMPAIKVDRVHSLQLMNPLREVALRRRRDQMKMIVTPFSRITLKS